METWVWNRSGFAWQIPIGVSKVPWPLPTAGAKLTRLAALPRRPRVVCNRRQLVLAGHVTCEWCSGGGVVGRGLSSATGLILARQFPSSEGEAVWTPVFARADKAFARPPADLSLSGDRIHSLYTQSSMRIVVGVSAVQPKWQRSERSASIARSFRSSCVAFEWVPRPIVVTRRQSVLIVRRTDRSIAIRACCGHVSVINCVCYVFNLCLRWLC